jgi:hypothetical protein
MSFSLYPQSIDEIRQLTIGTIAIPHNRTSGSLTINYNGSTTEISPVVLLVPGQPGRYKLTDFPPSTQISLSCLPSSLVNEGGDELLITACNHQEPLITNSNGTIFFDLGITLSTTGNGRSYLDGSYLGTLYISADIP